MATITYDRTILVNQEEAERWAEIADKPAMPIPEEAIRMHKESLRRGKEWMKQFSNTPQST
ncbi:MAG: hypothetical protein FWG68_09345 [Defluviitaleaceae bacterium]|nr:hypothetical protein [Defluviitaleaceae bacterium]